MERFNSFSLFPKSGSRALLYCTNCGESIAIASGDWKPPVAASRGKFVGIRVPGIISFGRRIQSEIQSWRRRKRASVRFGARDAVSAVLGTGGFSGLTGVV